MSNIERKSDSNFLLIELTANESESINGGNKLKRLRERLKKARGNGNNEKASKIIKKINSLGS